MFFGSVGGFRERERQKKQTLFVSCQKTSPRSRKPVIVFQLWGLTLPFGATLTSIFRLHPFFLCVSLSCNSRGFYPQGCPTLLGEISHTAEHYANYGSEEPRPTKKKKKPKTSQHSEENVHMQYGLDLWWRADPSGAASRDRPLKKTTDHLQMQQWWSVLASCWNFWPFDSSWLEGEKKNKAVSEGGA